MKNSAVSDFTWRDVQKELYSAEEIAESDLRVALIGELIKARNEKGISQKRLEELSGVKQPMIARIESGKTLPQVNTLIKLLVPLGKTLAIVPNRWGVVDRIERGPLSFCFLEQRNKTPDSVHFLKFFHFFFSPFRHG